MPRSITGVEQLLGAAGKALRAGQLQSARQSLERALSLNPESATAYRLLGVSHHMGGEYALAIKYLQRACQLSPDTALTHMGLGIALHDHGDIDAAIASFERACQLAPDQPACWFNLGKALKLRGRFDDPVCDVLQRALELDPAHFSARITLADAQTSLGKIHEAVANYREILRRHPHNDKAWLALANVKTAPFSATDVAKIREALVKTESASDARIALGFALAKALEDQADYAAAFAALREVNAAKRRTVHWDAASTRAHIDAIQNAFRAPVGGSTDASKGEEIIFVVSLPRAGSTLVEQILASHPQVTGAGEITDLQQVIDEESTRRGQPFPTWVAAANTDDWARLGRNYLSRTAAYRSSTARSTDKNLLNWQLVGAALAMLPGASVISVRRDPLETCLACYRQLFNTGNYFTYDLADMAAYLKDHERLCKHWKETFPRRFFEQHYESLLADPQPEIRRLLKFCELDFDSACLHFEQTRRVVRTASAAQVRQPLQRNTARAGSYGNALAPLRAALER